MKVVLEGYKAEHRFYRACSEYLVVVGQDAAADYLGKYNVAVTDSDSVAEVVRYYSESDLPGVSTLVHIGKQNYEEMMEVARTAQVGVLIKLGGDDLAFKALSGVISFDLDELALREGYAVNAGRYINVLARSVPGTLSKQSALEKVRKVFPNDERQAVAAFQKASAKVYDEFFATRHINLQGVVSRKLGSDLSLASVTKVLADDAKSAYISGGVFVLNLEMGRGKTSAFVSTIVDLANEHQEKSSFITHRHSILESLTFSGAMKLCTDPEISRKEDKLDGLSLIVNRCAQLRFQAHLARTDVLVIDEVAQVFRHVANKEFQGAHDEVWGTLIQLISSARLVVLTDACINNELMDILKSTGREVNYLSEDYSQSRGIVEYGLIDQVRGAIMAAHDTLDPILIGVDSRREAELQAKIATEKRRKVLLVTKYTIGSPEVKKFFANPDNEIKNYDVIIYTPAMQSAVSITRLHFKYHFFMFFRVVGVDEARQMTRRDRTAIKLVIGTDKPFSYRETSIKYWKKRISSFDSSFVAFCAKTEHKLALEFNNFQQWLAISLETAGFEVSNIDYVPSQSVIEDIKITKSLLSFAEKREVIDMLGLARKLSAAPDLSEERLIDARVVDFLNYTKMPLGCINFSDIDFMFSNGWQDKVYNTAAWLLDDEEFHHFVQEVVKPEWGSKKYIHQRRLNIRSVMDLICTEADDGVIQMSEVSRACELIRGNRSAFLGLGLTKRCIPAHTPRAEHSLISNFLASLGLSKRRTTKNVYVLDPEKLKQMNDYIYAWLLSNKPGKTFRKDRFTDLRALPAHEKLSANSISGKLHLA